MSLTCKNTIKKLLKHYNFQPSQGLGQNFLIDKKTLKKIIETAEIKPQDIILEIGPGLGTLTVELAARAKKIIAVEKDIKMIKALEENLKNFKNIEIINKDILKIEVHKLKNGFNKIVGNLPFYITAHVIRKFLEEKNNHPLQMFFIVQKEVGQRICAKPPKMNLLAVSVQFYAEPRIISYISNKSFYPQPKVDSAIIKLKTKSTRRKIKSDLFFKIVKAGFSQPRKQLINNLSKKLDIKKENTENWLLKNNIKPNQRAESLALEDWIRLTESYLLL